MRTLIIAILLGLVTFVSPINAQIKKPVVKPKTTLAKVPAINTIDVFNESSDDATQILSDELKKLNVILDDIEEYHFYKYDEHGKKLNTINNSVKKLIFNKGITAYIHINNIDAIKEVSFSIEDKKYNKNIKKLLGYANWPTVARSEKDTTFKSGYFIVNTNTISQEDEDGKKVGDAYTIAMKQISPYLFKPSKIMGFEAKALTVHDNVDDIGYAIVELMKKQGIGLLYKEDELPASNNDGLLNYYTTYNFVNGITVDINTNKKRMLSEINFACNNPIVFIKLKRELKILEFEHTGSDAENSLEYYQYKNVNSTVFSKQKAINFYVLPVIEDVETRYQNTEPISAENLVNLYLKNDSTTIKTHISNNYVNNANVDWINMKMTYNMLAPDFGFYFKSPADSISYVEYEYKLSDTWSRIIYFSTRDKFYYEKIKTELTQIANAPGSEIIINFSDTPYAITRMPYISIFSKAQDEKVKQKKQLLAQQKEQERQELLARQQQQREEQVERDRLKAEKAAKSAADIQKVGDALIKGLQDIQRAKKGGGK